jgi:death-on-curing family protein
MEKKNLITIYEGAHGPVEIEIDKNAGTVWVTQEQIAKLFEVDRSVITKHINNIFKVNELIENRVCAIFAHTANDGKTYQTKFYNLDAILSIGYRVNSIKATLFRQWATKTLNKYITEGIVVNKALIRKNYTLFQKAVNDVKTLIPQTTSVEAFGILDLINSFARTWLSLDAYDKSKLPQKGSTVKRIDLSADELIKDIQSLKQNLLEKNQATEIFGQERETGNIQSIVRNVYQSFSGQELYPTIEDKAANLLYFVVKNHPFVDGNKRSGAFTFIWFLRKAGILTPMKISPELLTTLTIMVAESKMEDRVKMIGIILMILKS